MYHSAGGAHSIDHAPSYAPHHMLSVMLGNSQGDSLMHVHRAIPDFFLDGSVDLTMQTKYYPQASEVKETIGTVTPTTQKINTRIRARNMALRIESDDTGDYWKYGSVKIDQRTDGRR